MSRNPYEAPKEFCTPAGDIEEKPAGSRVWLKIRVTLTALGFLVGLIVPQEHVAELATLPPWGLRFLVVCGGVGILLMPVMLLFPLAIQAVNPLSDKEWGPPSHSSNPLHFGNPLLCLHFAAYLCIAQGVGILGSSLWNGICAAAMGLFMLLGGISLLAGVRLSMVVFRSKMVEGLEAE